MSHQTKRVKVYCRYAIDDEQRCIKESLQYREIDVEIADEIEELTTKYGIRTTCSCSGHGENNGYIMVNSKDVGHMETLGYSHPSDDNYCHICGCVSNAFIPKSKR